MKIFTVHVQNTTVRAKNLNTSFLEIPYFSCTFVVGQKENAMFQFSNLRNVVAIAICLVAVNMIVLGCGKTEEDKRLNVKEMELYELIMEYRKGRGLPQIPISESLTYVAQLHVKDLQENHERGTNCNMHSWSDKGVWSPCCYTDDHAQANCMWNKPRELTSYTGNGYEIAYWTSSSVTPREALSSWKNSPGHNRVIINEDVWSDHLWNAIGIGISNNYAVVWFGEKVDE